MKISINGAGEVVLSEVYCGVGIETDAGLFGIAQRDGGIEVRLNGETIYCRGHNPPEDWAVRLPDGSGAFTASWPLPRTHWLYAEGREEPPMSMRFGIGPRRKELADQIRDAARYAIRRSTMNGKTTDFDPDAMVQNMIIGLLGYWTDDGLSHT